MIRALVLDYGNVISVANTGDCADKMEAMTGVPAGIFRSVYDKFRFDFDRGLISGTEMYKILLRDAGYHDIAKNTQLMTEIAMLDMQSWRAYRQDVTDWAMAVQRHGYKLGILSNMPSEFLRSYRHEIPLFAAADYACFSCDIHIIKPERGIYDDCVRGLGIQAAEAVFFDDRQENVDAGNAFGMRSFLWTGLRQARRDWDNAVRDSGGQTLDANRVFCYV